jgi:hypothetical protein
MLKLAKLNRDQQIPVLKLRKSGKLNRDRTCYGTPERAAFAVRVYREGAKSFIFVYRLNDRQHFIRIGKTPLWSLEAAREMAKKLRSILDQGARGVGGWGGHPAFQARAACPNRPILAAIRRASPCVSVAQAASFSYNARSFSSCCPEGRLPWLVCSFPRQTCWR